MERSDYVGRELSHAKSRSLDALTTGTCTFFGLALIEKLLMAESSPTATNHAADSAHASSSRAVVARAPLIESFIASIPASSSSPQSSSYLSSLRDSVGGGSGSGSGAAMEGPGGQVSGSAHNSVPTGGGTRSSGSFIRSILSRGRAEFLSLGLNELTASHRLRIFNCLRGGVGIATLFGVL